MKRLISGLLLGLALCTAAHAAIDTYTFKSEAEREQFRQLTAELRCPKCQNQNIADSNAPISQDLRKLLHQQLEAGADDEEILDYMVARYGEFVRYRPRFSGATAVLWLAPVLLLLVGVAAAVLTLRSRRSQRLAAGPLNRDDEQRLQDLLGKTEKDS
jgi:cytochrome c-type biogenesis protein CcmH